MNHLTTAVAAIALSLSSAHAQKADPAAVAQHIANATAAAKSDLLGPLGLCKTATPTPGPSFMDMYKAAVNEPPLAPMQVMDELYFLGAKWSTAWALKTSAGIIIIDSMDNSDEAENYIAGGLRKLGLNPADIKYVIVSHAHGDHDGGAGYLKEKFGPRIVMSEIDWQAEETAQRDPLFGTKRNPLFSAPPKRDMAVNDGETITLGDTTIKLYVIPGHTLGTLATVFTVHDRGEAHRAVAWGGTAYNFGPLPDRLQLYSDTTVKYRGVMKTENADIFLSNHVAFDNAVPKMAALKERKAGEPNPFVVGQDTVQRFLTILGECALATRASIGENTAGK
ncbi:MBL fold metallo-hydrolase [Bradyrhizobium jicamae]|uniref:MBL fold metallo-hydrolase n=1 Tax=Bradyrhizobium jicamae TaxID=280332 RepID=UPI001BAC5724|nr:MBL fold metallo-hydrolase [Bradyrhizobium jicamae]MBR0753100.1 MBL fold metallo-hydrolase [Bradyrhizobium jicamae]